MQEPSVSSVALDAQIGSATVAPPITPALRALPTIDKTETNNKVIISQNLFLILHSFADPASILVGRREACPASDFARLAHRGAELIIAADFVIQLVVYFNGSA
jgi:hypothetical protein